MAKIDWPDMHMGFWVALGVIAAFAVVAMARMLLSRAAGGRQHG